MEKRLDKMEGMITELITMIEAGGQMKIQKDAEISQEGCENDMENRLANLENRLEQLEAGQAQLHSENREIIDQLHLIRADHNHTWEKAVQNERQIAILNSKVSV